MLVLEAGISILGNECSKSFFCCRRYCVREGLPCRSVQHVTAFVAQVPKQRSQIGNGV